MSYVYYNLSTRIFHHIKMLWTAKQKDLQLNSLIALSCIIFFLFLKKKQLVSSLNSSLHIFTKGQNQAIFNIILAYRLKVLHNIFLAKKIYFFKSRISQQGVIKMSTKRDENTNIQVGIRVRPPIQRYFIILFLYLILYVFVWSLETIDLTTTSLSFQSLFFVVFWQSQLLHQFLNS